MNNITIVASGQNKIVAITKLFGSFGPWCIEGKRIDQLADVILLSDGTSSTFIESGVGTSKASTGSVIGRSLVGGLLTGGVGAIIGGSTASRNEIFESKVTEQKIYDFTVKLLWKDSSAAIAQINNPSDLRWLASFIGQPEMSENEIEEARRVDELQRNRGAIFDKIKSEINSEFPIIFSKDQPSLAAVIAVLSVFLVAGIAGFISDGFFVGVWWSIKFGFSGLVLIAIADGIFRDSHNKKVREIDSARKILFDKKMADLVKLESKST